MRTVFHIGSRTFELRPAGELEASGDGRELAIAEIRRLAPHNRDALRRALARLRPGLAVRGLEDHSVLRALETALRSGGARLVEIPRGPDPSRTGAPEEETEPAPTSARAPRTPTTWVEIQLIGEDDLPIPGERYRLELPDGSTREGRLDASGLARVDGIDPGTCVVTFPALDEEAWAPT